MFGLAQNRGQWQTWDSVKGVELLEQLSDY
jgi:hypothetical protein